LALSGRVVHLLRQYGNTFVEQPLNAYEYRFGLSGARRELQIRRRQKLLVILSRRA
jgi:hypothetical protein